MTVKFDCGDAAGLLLCVVERLERAAGRIDGIALQCVAIGSIPATPTQIYKRMLYFVAIGIVLS